MPRKSDSPSEAEVENLVRTALQNLYGDDIQDEIIENVETEYIESDGRHHILQCRARSLAMETGDVYHHSVSGKEIEIRVEDVLGIGGEYALRVNFD